MVSQSESMLPVQETKKVFKSLREITSLDDWTADEWILNLWTVRHASVGLLHDWNKSCEYLNFEFLIDCVVLLWSARKLSKSFGSLDHTFV